MKRSLIALGIGAGVGALAVALGRRPAPAGPAVFLEREPETAPDQDYPDGARRILPQDLRLLVPEGWLSSAGDGQAVLIPRVCSWCGQPWAFMDGLLRVCGECDLGPDGAPPTAGDRETA